MTGATKTQAPSDKSTNKESVDGDHLEQTYPEQRHAGAVGLGPNYNQSATFMDKVTGLKEEMKGKITKNPELVAKGHDRVTGELKHKRLDEDLAKDPFASPEKAPDATPQTGNAHQQHAAAERHGAMGENKPNPAA